MDLQIKYNMEIALEGLTGKYGVSIGKTLLDLYGHDIMTKIKAYTASASEARMGGSVMPVVINSGSGNQGLTSSVPIIVYAKEKGFSQEMLYRSLVLSNLITIHQKKHIGLLSGFCGVVCAACASGAALTYIEGGDVQQISKTIMNTLANVSGIICDGAKPSCASKISSGLDAAILAHHLALKGRVFEANTGILKTDAESTITSVGRVAKEGMKETDRVILSIMLEQV
jgi:L-cysteine desulfidase